MNAELELQIQEVWVTEQKTSYLPKTEEQKILYAAGYLWGQKSKLLSKASKEKKAWIVIEKCIDDEKLTNCLLMLILYKEWSTVWQTEAPSCLPDREQSISYVFNKESQRKIRAKTSLRDNLALVLVWQKQLSTEQAMSSEHKLNMASAKHEKKKKLIQDSQQKNCSGKENNTDWYVYIHRLAERHRLRQKTPTKEQSRDKHRKSS